jgi:tetratricopeptide (TPR) repeat protein
MQKVKIIPLSLSRDYDRLKQRLEDGKLDYRYFTRLFENVNVDEAKAKNETDRVAIQKMIRDIGVAKVNDAVMLPLKDWIDLACIKFTGELTQNGTVKLDSLDRDTIIKSSNVFFSVGSFKQSVGQLEDAMQGYQASLDLRGQAFGSDHPSWYEAAGAIACTLRDAGFYEKALEYFEGCRKGIASHVGDDDNLVADVEIEIAQTLMKTNEFAKARLQLLHAKDVWSKLAESHSQLAGKVTGLNRLLESIEMQDFRQQCPKTCNQKGLIQSSDRLSLEQNNKNASCSICTCEITSFFFGCTKCQYYVCPNCYSNDRASDLDFLRARLQESELHLKEMEQLHQENTNTVNSLLNAAALAATLNKRDNNPLSSKEQMTYLNRAFEISQRIYGANHLMTLTVLDYMFDSLDDGELLTLNVDMQGCCDKLSNILLLNDEKDNILALQLCHRVAKQLFERDALRASNLATIAYESGKRLLGENDPRVVTFHLDLAYLFERVIVTLVPADTSPSGSVEYEDVYSILFVDCFDSDHLRLRKEPPNVITFKDGTINMAFSFQVDAEEAIAHYKANGRFKIPILRQSGTRSYDAHQQKVDLGPGNAKVYFFKLLHS